MKRERPPSRRALEHAAADYIARYSPNSRRLRAFLERRGGVPEDIEAIVSQAQGQGVVDDVAWAASRARRLLGRGVSPTVARQRLRAEGLDAQGAIAGVAEEQGDAELYAARAYARRRRMGPWRAERSAETRQADLARMGRAGFSYAVAVRVLDGDV